MADVTAKLAEALRLISFASMDRGARDTATEALAAYEQAQAEPVALNAVKFYSNRAATPAPAEPAWIAAFDEARDAILNDRGPLEGEAMSDTQTNAVLSILDDAFMPHLKREQP